MSEKTTVRQDIWQAAVGVLSEHLPRDRARDIANQIVDVYSGKRKKVSPEVELEIRKRLLTTSEGMNKIGKECGVGTSTVQRIAEELSRANLLPATRRMQPVAS